MILLRLKAQATSSLNQLFGPKDRHGNDLQPVIVGHIRTLQVSKMGQKAHFMKTLIQKFCTANFGVQKLAFHKTFCEFKARKYVIL